MTNPYLIAAIILAMTALSVLVGVGFIHGFMVARHTWQRFALGLLGTVLLWLLLASLLDYAQAQS